MMTAQAIDDVLAGTFPASDPPAWTPGIARPAPQIARPPADRDPDPRPTVSEHPLTRAVVSLLWVAGLALLVPFVVLAVGAPVALGLRAVLELAGGVLAAIR